jgi:hypothetical protein
VRPRSRLGDMGCIAPHMLLYARRAVFDGIVCLAVLIDATVQSFSRWLLAGWLVCEQYGCRVALTPLQYTCIISWTAACRLFLLNFIRLFVLILDPHSMWLAAISAPCLPYPGVCRAVCSAGRTICSNQCVLAANVTLPYYLSLCT